MVFFTHSSYQLPDGDPLGEEDLTLFKEGILEMDTIGVEARKIRQVSVEYLSLFGQRLQREPEGKKS